MGNFAGFWLRFIAAFIDGIIMFVVQLAVGALLGENIVLNYAVNLVVAWLYFALMESSSWQATLGKKALGIVVTDTEGNRIGFGRATGRYFGKIVSGVILFIGYIMAGFTAKKQALHDILANTLVVRSGAEASNTGVSA